MTPTRVMGILNLTPDSFSDGGRYARVDGAVARAEAMAAEGADLIDVGGESTRPGADEVGAAEQIRRVVPVLERISDLGVPLSVDTRSAEVARAALQAGASIVNDVSGGTHDPEILRVAAESGARLVLMHMRGTPKTMDGLVDYGDDVVGAVVRELCARVGAAVAAGVPRERILVDPGLGFSKTPEQSLELVARVGELRVIGLPLVVGPSRKRFVGHVLGAPVDDRLAGTLAVVAWCVRREVDVVRVHDVREARHVVDMTSALAVRNGS